MAGRTFLIDGVSMTAEEVGALENPTDSQKKQFIQQCGLSDQRVKEIEGMAGALAPAIRLFVGKSMAPFTDRFVKLEQTVAEIQQRPSLKYQGVWSAEKTYAPGTFITHGGSVWHSDVESTGVRPGEGGNVIWKLAVKRGGSK
jgi:hypothetical protein